MNLKAFGHKLLAVPMMAITVGGVLLMAVGAVILFVLLKVGEWVTRSRKPSPTQPLNHSTTQPDRRSP